MRITLTANIGIGLAVIGIGHKGIIHLAVQRRRRDADRLQRRIHLFRKARLAIALNGEDEHLVRILRHQFRQRHISKVFILRMRKRLLRIGGKAVRIKVLDPLHTPVVIGTNRFIFRCHRDAVRLLRAKRNFDARIIGSRFALFARTLGTIHVRRHRKDTVRIAIALRTLGNKKLQTAGPRHKGQHQTQRNQNPKNQIPHPDFNRVIFHKLFINFIHEHYPNTKKIRNQIRIRSLIVLEDIAPKLQRKPRRIPEPVQRRHRYMVAPNGCHITVNSGIFHLHNRPQRLQDCDNSTLFFCLELSSIIEDAADNCSFDPFNFSLGNIDI